MGCMVSTASSCAWALLCLRCQERKKLSLHPPMPWFLVSLWSFSESLLLHHLTEVLGCCSGDGFTAGTVTEICSGRWHDLLPAVCHQQISPVFASALLHTCFPVVPVQPVWKLVWRSSFAEELLCVWLHQLPMCSSPGDADRLTFVIYPLLLITHPMSVTSDYDLILFLKWCMIRKPEDLELGVLEFCSSNVNFLLLLPLKTCCLNIFLSPMMCQVYFGLSSVTKLSQSTD